MNKKTLAALLAQLFVELPIWFYLIYILLEKAQVDRLVWFLYIVYLPVTIFTAILFKLGMGDDK